jgi:hypothetical protein
MIQRTTVVTWHLRSKISRETSFTHFRKMALGGEGSLARPLWRVQFCQSYILMYYGETESYHHKQQNGSEIGREAGEDLFVLSDEE